MKKNLQQIAKLPQSRAEWWVQWNFKVLPTDERFRALTSEQIELMFEEYLIDNPNLRRQGETYHNPDYEAELAKLDSASSVVKTHEKELLEIASSLAENLKV